MGKESRDWAVLNLIPPHLRFLALVLLVAEVIMAIICPSIKEESTRLVVILIMALIMLVAIIAAILLSKNLQMQAANPSINEEKSLSEKIPTNSENIDIPHILSFSSDVVLLSRNSFLKDKFKSKKVSYMGIATDVEVESESIIFTSMVIDENSPEIVPVEVTSSGLCVIEPVVPQDISIDVPTFFRVKGSSIRAIINRNNSRYISYRTRRYNAHLPLNEDYGIVQIGRMIDEMVLTLDFSRVLGHCAFKKLPCACTETGAEKKESREVEMSSRYGKTWQAVLHPKNQKEGLKVSWELCDGFPDNPKYVFGYASLMHPESLCKTLEGKDPLNVIYLPSKLSGYRRTWSAIWQNNTGDTAADKKYKPDYLSFMNIERSDLDDALGIVTPVTNDNLAKLDIREGNYVRFDVTEDVSVLCGTIEPDAKIFTYISFAPFVPMPEESTIGYREDYKKIIKVASQLIDKKYNLSVGFEQDFDNVCKAINLRASVLSSDFRTTNRYSMIRTDLGV